MSKKKKQVKIHHLSFHFHMCSVPFTAVTVLSYFPLPLSFCLSLPPSRPSLHSVPPCRHTTSLPPSRHAAQLDFTLPCLFTLPLPFLSFLSYLLLYFLFVAYCYCYPIACLLCYLLPFCYLIFSSLIFFLLSYEL